MAAHAQYIVPNCVDVQKQNSRLTFQLEQTQKQLADTIVKLDRAWIIIHAYRIETAKMRSSYDVLKKIPLEALALVQCYQQRRCFLGLCYRKRMKRLQELLSKAK